MQRRESQESSEIPVTPVETPEEKPKKQQKMTVKEAYDIGRLLGFLKKKDPDLYEEIVREAEANKQKPTDIIYESLCFRYLSMRAQVAKLSAAELLAAFEFWYQLNKLVINQQMTMLHWFFSEGLKTYGQMVNLIEEKYREVEEAEKAAAPVEEKPKLPEDVKKSFFDYVIGFMGNVMGMVNNIALLPYIMQLPPEERQKYMKVMAPAPTPMQQSMPKVKVVEKGKPKPQPQVVENLVEVKVGGGGKGEASKKA